MITLKNVGPQVAFTLYMKMTNIKLNVIMIYTWFGHLDVSVLYGFSMFPIIINVDKYAYLLDCEYNQCFNVLWE